MSSRRALLGLGGLLGSAGCGFRPLYAPITAEDGGSTDLRDELAAVRVGNIPERSGQLLRRDLQRRFEGVRPGVPARYGLQVALAYSVEPLGYRRDGTITRLRYTATGAWTLATLAVPPRRIAASAIPVRTLDLMDGLMLLSRLIRPSATLWICSLALQATEIGSTWTSKVRKLHLASIMACFGEPER